MPIVLRHARAAVAMLFALLLSHTATRPALAAESMSKGYAETINQNHNGVGVSFGVGGLNGLAYRRYFGNYAVQADIFPVIADGGSYLAVFGGLTFIDYLVLWNRASRSTLLPATSALRFVASTGVWLSRNQSSNFSVSPDNCHAADCQSITHRAAPIDYFAHVGLGLGIEMGAIARPGFSAAFDVQMTVMWDQIGLYGVYPLPAGTLMYSW